MAHLDDMDELYDLEADPYELENLAQRGEHRAVLADMQHRLVRAMSACEDGSEDSRRLVSEFDG